MTSTDERVLATLARANPRPPGTVPEPSGDPAARAMLTAILATPVPTPPSPPRRSRARPLLPWRGLAALASLLVVLAVAAVALHAGASRRSGTIGIGGGSADELVLRMHPTSETPRITTAAVAEELQIIRTRLRDAGAPPVRVTRRGDELVVHSREVARSPRAAVLLTAEPRIALTDWEANVLAPDGRTVASLLPHDSAVARTLSEGGVDGPGADAGGGALALYDAVRLASRQPRRADTPAQTRRGDEWFAFASPGAPGCRTSTIPCGVAGAQPTRAAAARAGRRAGAAHAVVLSVPQGTIVVHAIAPGIGRRPGARRRPPRYYVLRDDAALTALDLDGSRDVTDAAGTPAVSVSLTPAGIRAFRTLTATVARRGRALSGSASTFQHFAVIVDGALVSVPTIDFRQYPDGVSGSRGVEIEGDLTRAGARTLATELGSRMLPLGLTVVRGG